MTQYARNYQSLVQDRVEKQDVPLLVIGLGGTGIDSVHTIKKTFAERFILPTDRNGEPKSAPRRTAYLGIDYDRTSRIMLDSSEFVHISLPKLPELLNDRDLLRESEKAWIHRDLRHVGHSATRAIARLILERNYASVYHAIVESLRRLVETAAGGYGIRGVAQIVVVTGIGGGMGSGTFLDIGQILRHIMRSEPTLNQFRYNLSCYVVMPDVTTAHLLEEGTASMTPFVQANGYAALRELDFWMNYDRHRTHYVMNYMGAGYDVPVTWGKPYDQVILMCGANVGDTSFKNAYQLAQRTIAEYLFNMMVPDQIGEDGSWAMWAYWETPLHLLERVKAQNIRRPPANYTYRAIGVCSRSIPWDKIFLAESRLLFETLIPMRDSRGRLVPNDSLLKDGKAQQRFSFVAKKSFQQLYHEFSTYALFPKILAAPLAMVPLPPPLVAALKAQNTPLHLTYEKWCETEVANHARTFAESYKQEVWAQFRTLCRAIMADPLFGPFSLRQFLEDPDQSLLVAFTNYADNANGLVNDLRTRVMELRQVCINNYSYFLDPPLLYGKRAMQSYLDALRDLYDTVRQRELARAYAHALQMTVRYIKAYITDSLSPLCAKLLELEADLGDAAQAGNRLGIDLFDASILNDEMQNIFTDANKQNDVSRGFLGKLCDLSFDSKKSVDADTCGLAFTFREDGERSTLELLRREMDVCFRQLNFQSLDSIIARLCADPDPVQESKRRIAYTRELVRSGIDHALPMFSLNSKHRHLANGNEIVKGIHISVPHDAPDLLDDMRADFDAVYRKSHVTDRIHFAVVWDGLPLYAYSQMDALKRAYHQAVLTPNGSVDLHLVWDGHIDSGVGRNWTRLPDLAPFYLFSTDADPTRELRLYEEAHRLVERALTCGMLTINSTADKPEPLPVYTFRVFRRMGMLADNESMEKRLDELLDHQDKALVPREARLAAMTQLLNEAETTVLQADASPIVMCARLGLDPDTDPVDPFDGPVSDPGRLRKATENYDRLTAEYATHILLQDPVLLYEVGRQIDVFEAIAALAPD